MQDTATKIVTPEKDWLTQFQEVATEYAPKIVAALVILIVGLFVVNMIVRLSKRLMKKRGIDATLQKFLTRFVIELCWWCFDYDFQTI